MPRALGVDNGEPVSVGIGRFGPFAKRGSTYAS
ncbi:topoisomerase C-terminal repeat-containing protein, partial [Enterobacter hormaechei]